MQTFQHVSKQTKTVTKDYIFYQVQVVIIIKIESRLVYFFHYETREKASFIRFFCMKDYYPYPHRHFVQPNCHFFLLCCI